MPQVHTGQRLSIQQQRLQYLHTSFYSGIGGHGPLMAGRLDTLALLHAEHVTAVGLLCSEHVLHAQTPLDHMPPCPSAAGVKAPLVVAAARARAASAAAVDAALAPAIGGSVLESRRDALSDAAAAEELSAAGEEEDGSSPLPSSSPSLCSASSSELLAPPPLPAAAEPPAPGSRFRLFAAPPRPRPRRRAAPPRA